MADADPSCRRCLGAGRTEDPEFGMDTPCVCTFGLAKIEVVAAESFEATRRALVRAAADLATLREAARAYRAAVLADEAAQHTTGTGRSVVANQRQAHARRLAAERVLLALLEPSP